MLYPNAYAYGDQQAISPSTASDLTIAAQTASKRASLPDGAVSSPRAAKRSRKSGSAASNQVTASPIMNQQQMPVPMHAHTDPTLIQQDSSPASKPRRVRTGCLTCRERHLKCDEASPVCQNCRKSNRQCKRGVRLNFIDTTVRQPTTMAPIHDWAVNFQDESREIASEYRGGLARYANVGIEEPADPQYHVQDGLLYELSTAAMNAQQQIPPFHGLPDPFEDSTMGQIQQQRESAQRYSVSQPGQSYPVPQIQTATAPSYAYAPQASPNDKGDFIREAKELSYMQAFVEEVGLWMDSMDADKHFSEQLPHHALTSPMLYNAFLACGARHLSITSQPQQSTPNTADTDALQYYNTATSYLLQSLQASQPADRDPITCATTATILNVYEVMSERYKQHINHIKGARALIKECNWDARCKSGVGKACFWINIGMEVLSCLDRVERVAWEPEEWGVDLDWTHGRVDASDKDEVWTHRIVYVVAKIANFRAATIEGQTVDSPMTRQTRMQEWQHLKSLLDAWQRHAPRTMHPMGVIEPLKTRLHSAFPDIWLIKRTSIMARLLYHTGLVLLAQLNPHQSREMQELAYENAFLTCGIVAHNKDRGVSSIAIRSLAIAGEILTDIQQQQEVLQILERVAKNTGWNVQGLFKELPRKWGWPEGQSRPRTASINARQEPMLAPDQVSNTMAPSVQQAASIQRPQNYPYQSPPQHSAPSQPYAYPGVAGLPNPNVGMGQRSGSQGGYY